MNLQPIDTAPLDGTEIVLYHSSWDALPIAQWQDWQADDNPAGWLLRDEFGMYGNESEGFLGWDEDTMPTHWMPLVPPEVKP